MAIHELLVMNDQIHRRVNAALEWLASLMLGIVLHETIANYVHTVLQFMVGDLVPQRWVLLLVFASVSWGGCALLRKFLHRDDEASEDDQEGGESLADPIGGAA